MQQLGLNTPESLANTAWFYTLLYFGKRGRENQRVMEPRDFQLKTTTSGLKYFVLSERATKNHPGGESDNEDESQSVMMAWPGNPCCPVACLEKYLAKRDHDVMPFDRNRKTTMQALSVQQMRSGFVMYPWRSTSWRIS